MIFYGSCVALVTPFDDSGNVNYFSLKNLIEFQIASGTKAICILGTTGESSAISESEREKIIKFCACLISKRVPLIVGTGSNCTKTAIRLSKQAEQLGADAVLVVTPYYNKCNQDGLFAHYKSVANSISLPVIMYNVPSRTSVNILPQTVLKLSKIKNIVAIKEASGNISQITEIISSAPKDFAVYSGDDMMCLAEMAIGAKGVISVTANCYPTLIFNMTEFVKNGDIFNASRINLMLAKINKALFLDINPICVKFYMNLLGHNVGGVRLPLTEPSAEIKKKLLEVKNYYEN